MPTANRQIERKMMFVDEDADRHRLPVALLSGFLGSGKTTLLNALLRDPRLADTAVAINEFGEVPLDQHLIDHGDDKTVVMANGCLCCNLAGDMEDALMRIFSRRDSGAIPRFARLIVEPSGLADPAPIAQAILRNPLMSRVLRLDTTLATVDAVFGPRQLDQHADARKQVAFADRILLTKTDLAGAADTASLKSRLARLNPTAAIIEVLHGFVDPSRLFAEQFFDTFTAPSAIAQWLDERVGGAARETHAHEHKLHSDASHCETMHALSIVCETPLSWTAFETWLRQARLGFAEDLLRCKGILNIAGLARPLVIQGVHHVLHPPIELDSWPNADHRSRLVFITRGQIGEQIRARWAAALPELTSNSQAKEAAHARH
jgi:G3E family GTPase